MNEQLITMVIALREAQKADIEKRTRATMAERQKCETRVDIWIAHHIAECVQLDLWSRSVKSSETPGAYNVTDETEAENGCAA